MAYLMEIAIMILENAKMGCQIGLETIQTSVQGKCFQNQS